MKTIEPINIWDNGINKQALVLDTYVCNLILNINATFQYSLFSLDVDGNIDECLKQGTVFMNEQNYALWNTDDVAWDFIAAELKLTITGDYIRPTLQEVIS